MNPGVIFRGGSDGNARLTGATAVVLLVLLAAEGATLLAIHTLLRPHIFLGLLLIPPILLKLAAVGWRFGRYYLRSDEYARRGPPHPLLRFVVAPAVAVSTLTLFATGIAAAALRRRGILLGLHKVSFVVWFGAMTLHVLWHVTKLPALVRGDWWQADGAVGTGVRRAAIGGAVALGLLFAVTAFPLVDHWQDAATGVLGVDAS